MARRKVKLDTDDQRASLFMEIIGHLMRYNDEEKRNIAEEAGVHWVTLYSWCSGITQKPRIDTLSKVAEALGYEIVLKRVNVKAALKVIKGGKS